MELTIYSVAILVIIQFWTVRLIADSIFVSRMYKGTSLMFGWYVHS